MYYDLVESGKRIKALKKEHGLTQEQLAEQLGVAANTIARIETGNRGISTLRRTNRIRTIHGSLAIEQNTLSLGQVTAVLNGKQVLAPPKDIAEVKNAYEIYERLEELDPYSVDDLLTAHSIMTRGLVDESGVFRSKPVGVVDQEGHVLHFALCRSMSRIWSWSCWTG